MLKRTVSLKRFFPVPTTCSGREIKNNFQVCILSSRDCSVHFTPVFAALKPEIVEVLEKHRDEEIAERREKRKKSAEEEAAKKEQEQKNKADNKEQLMEVKNFFV